MVAVAAALAPTRALLSGKPAAAAALGRPAGRAQAWLRVPSSRGRAVRVVAAQKVGCQELRRRR